MVRKQIGLAIHSYIGFHDVLPPAGSVDRSGNSVGGGSVPQTASIHMRLTVDLEQQALYNAYNFLLGDVFRGAAVPANTTVMSTPLAAYFCPSDPHPGNTGPLAGGIGASSAHPGGVNVLLMDGSVRFVKDGIDRAAWRALATRGGGEMANTDPFGGDRYRSTGPR